MRFVTDSARPTLLIATKNEGKLRELRGLTADLAVEIAGLDSFPDAVEIDETAATFAGNAALKAAGYAMQTGHITLADDSGLEVEALGGRPGVLSARYGGGGTPFSEKMKMLLAELEKTGSTDRRARFVASIAIADETGAIIHTAEGICQGSIAEAPRGTGGFGYDPLFIPDGYDKTFGELPDAIKQEISHRTRAFLKIVPILRAFVAI
jgi:XTP/dITP diphosphohydrolase